MHALMILDNGECLNLLKAFIENIALQLARELAA